MITAPLSVDGRALPGLLPLIPSDDTAGAVAASRVASRTVQAMTMA